MCIYAQHKTHKTKNSMLQNQNLVFAMSNYIRFLMIQNMTHLKQHKISSRNSHKNENTQHVNQSPYLKHEKFATSKHVCLKSPKLI